MDERQRTQKGNPDAEQNTFNQNQNSAVLLKVDDESERLQAEKEGRHSLKLLSLVWCFCHHIGLEILANLLDRNPLKMPEAL